MLRLYTVEIPLQTDLEACWPLVSSVAWMAKVGWQDGGKLKHIMGGRGSISSPFFVRWLFIIEGAGTMVAGMLAVVLLPDFPRSGQRKWLTEQEQRFAEWRLAVATNNEVDENGSIKQGLWDAVTDPKVWVLVLIQICQLTSQTWTYFFPVSPPSSFLSLNPC